MAKGISAFVTFLALALLSYGAAEAVHVHFLDLSSLVGVIGTALIWFFTSKGGFASKNADMAVQSTTGIKMNQQKFEFTPGAAFFAALAYTLLSIGAMFYFYRDYFS
ncbi:hypothetical protein GKZ89_07485 [Bacillus mangrovi]|uniref:Uncharacterized protein n=1 Tax=Metabacillus mangrovi TaxID=1491830 RepID=A0A7X2S3Y9_9BACI|nr:hypothetical protein [Metabacillus mangrovi]MTH53253.1 hypothetical protein [Metabacillus mangrovi]